MRSVRDMISDDGVKVGHFVTEFLTPGIGHVLKAAGCDLVGLDMEHTGFDFATMRAALRYLEAAGLPALVRPASKDYASISRLLDIGAEALLVQNIESAEEARRIVECMKYKPRGRRGVNVESFHDRFMGGPLGPKLEAANAGTVLFALIESEQGLRNVDAIAAVDGVDCLYIGHYDLGVDLGLGDQFAHPRMVEAMNRLAAAARKHGKALAWGLDSIGTLEDMRRSGAGFIFYGSDASVLRDAVGAGVRDIRRRCAAVDGGAAHR